MPMKTGPLFVLIWVGIGVSGGGCAPKRPAATAPEAEAGPPTPAAPGAPRNPSPMGATVTILSPANGALVSSPLKVVFDVQNMTLVPAGNNTLNSGHHHLLVDRGVPDLGQPIPKDAEHLHFGQSQTEAVISLAPGPHTLQLVLADGNHIAHNPPVISEPIIVTVQ